MKADVFIQYVDIISKMFRISKEEMFSKSKNRDVVDARQLLYYLCSVRPMRISYIQRYMNDNGCDVKHSTIIHGINAVTKKMSEDRDYVSIVRKLESKVTI